MPSCSFTLSFLQVESVKSFEVIWNHLISATFKHFDLWGKWENLATWWLLLVWHWRGPFLVSWRGKKKPYCSHLFRHLSHTWAGLSSRVIVFKNHLPCSAQIHPSRNWSSSFFLYSSSEEVSWDRVQQWWARTPLILFHFQKDQIFSIHTSFKERVTVGQKIVILKYPLHSCLLSWVLPLKLRKIHVGIPCFKQFMELKCCI